MKKVTTLFVMLLVAMLPSCSEDDSPKSLASNNAHHTQEVADGEWHLVQVTGSIAGINHLYEPGTITWTFNDDNTVDVINTNTNEQLTDFFESGTYNYGFVGNEDAPESCEFALIINNINFGCQAANEDEMTLTNTWADGYQLKFVKM